MSTTTEPFDGKLDAQVVVIGAGLSGLQAAHDLQKAGVSCLVLEARHRVGGKTWSVKAKSRHGTVELGAAWTNSVNQPRVLGLAKELGLELITQNVKGDVILEGQGRFTYGTKPTLSSIDADSYEKVLNTAERLCHQVDLLHPERSLPRYGDMSMADLATSLGATEVVSRLVNLWTCAMLGIESSNISAIYFLHYCRAGGGLLQMRSDATGGGQHLRFRAGSQSLSEGLYSRLRPGSVIFSTVVDGIHQSPQHGCVVTTTDGRSVRCLKVVSSLPSFLLRRMTFSPPLSADKSLMISQCQLGFYAKVILVYSKPWWRDLGLCGLTQGPDGPVTLTRDTSSDADETFDLTCFIVGQSGQKWSQSPKEERERQVLAHIDRIYGQTCPKPQEVHDQIWNKERFSEGAPCPVIPTSCLEALGRDQWKPEGHVHFAGTEMSKVWKGYMEGALTSGATTALEVRESLGLRATERAKL